MTKQRILRWGVCAWVVIAVAAAGTARAADAEEKAVGEAVAGFYAALNALFAGDAARMATVWSHDADVVYMGPGGGMQVGWDQVAAEWQRQAARKLGGSVTSAQMRITIGHDLAVVSNYEEGENTNTGGQPSKVSIRATNVFRKENASWKMIGHHTDLLPYLAK